MNHVFMNRMVVALALLLVGSTSLSSCKWIDAIKAKKIAAKEKEAKQAAEKSREIDKSFQVEASVEAQKEYDARKQYFYALDGDFEGTFVEIETSAKKDESKELAIRLEDAPIAVTQSKISVRVQTLHDTVKFSADQFVPAEQIRGQAEMLSWQFDVSEEFGVLDSVELTQRGACPNNEIKPDVKTGVMRFVCRASGLLGGRDYQFVLDDMDFSWQIDRTPETMLSRGATTSERLRNGGIAKIRSMNVKIIAGNAKEFFGKLERKN